MVGIWNGLEIYIWGGFESLTGCHHQGARRLKRTRGGDLVHTGVKRKAGEACGVLAKRGFNQEGRDREISPGVERGPGELPISLSNVEVINDLALITQSGQKPD